MIECEYVLKRDEKDVTKTYKPKGILKILPNLVYIEGPNSSGKSTLLHLIALGCHGAKNRQIKESLQEKINNLINSDHQDIHFEIKITDKNGTLQLLSEKKDFKDNEIILRDGSNNIISLKQFQRKYNLIYDIPENPTTRLKDLTIEIKDMQLWFASKLGILRSFLVKIIGDIQEARDPQKIVLVEKEISKLENRQKETTNTIGSVEEKLKEVKLFTFVKFYMDYKEIAQRLQNSIKDLRKEGTKKKKEKNKITEKFDELVKIVFDEVSTVEELYYKVTPILQSFFAKGKEKNRFSIWKDINVRKEFEKPDLIKNLKHEGSHFRELLDRQLEEEQKGSDLQEAQVFREIIKLLENYTTLRIKIPVADMTISNFIEALRKELKKHIDLIAKNDNMKDAIEKLNAILGKREYIVKELIPKIMSLGKEEEEKEATIDDYTDDYKIEKLKNQLAEYERSVDYYKFECSKMNVPEKDIKTIYPTVVLGLSTKAWNEYKESDLKDKIYDMETELTKKRKDLSTINDDLKYLYNDLENLKRKEPHQYQAHLDYLKDTLKGIQVMEQRINSFDSYMKQLIKGKYDSNEDIQDRNNYFEHVFSYLGKRVGRFRHIDQDYESTKIDLIKKEILTKCGKLIKIADLGTGQSQSAYLKGLLSGNDDRKIIALFDEVAMMDARSLNAVYEKLKELQNKGKLLIGIIIQKAEKLKVNPIS